METVKHSSTNWLTARMANIGEQVVRVFGTAIVDVGSYLQAIVDLHAESVVVERTLSIEERLQRSGRIRYR